MAEEDLARQPAALIHREAEVVVEEEEVRQIDHLEEAEEVVAVVVARRLLHVLAEGEAGAESPLQLVLVAKEEEAVGEGYRRMLDQ